MKVQFREGWSSLLLILGMLLAVAWSIEAAQWTDGLSLGQWAVIAGLLYGLLGAKSRLKGWFMHPAAGLISVACAAFLAGSLLPDKLSWDEKLDELRSRYLVWLNKALVGNTNRDNLVFLIECLLALFLISYFAAWFAYRRHETWPVILPAGAVLVLNIYNAQGSHNVYLFIYLLCALLYAVRAHLTAQEGWWQRARIGYNRLVGLDFLRDGAIFSIVVILFAQALPAAATNGQVEEAVRSLEGPWQGMREKWGQLFATLNYKPEPSGAGFFGANLQLGGALHLNSTTMMEARASTSNVHYWEAVVYDKYTGRGWENTDSVSAALRASDSRLSNSGFALREVVTQTFKVFYPTSQLFGVPQPIAWSRPIVALLNRDPNTDNGAPLTASMANSAVPTRANDEYTVLSLVSKADIKSLRKANWPYPSWVTDRYLQVPAMPARVKTLAERITRDSANNFDKASALERYLREQITYNEFIQPPPPDRDVVDYLLFTSRQGYCTYYASPMAVMLRLLGIPARVASGYALGEYDSENDVYSIRESDSHTWVEVFFPTYGWIQFEPTASKPPLERIEGANTSDDSASGSDVAGGNVPNPRDRDFLAEFDLQDDSSSGLFPLSGLEGAFTGMGYLGLLGLAALVVGLVAAAVGWQRHIASMTVLEAEYEGLQRYARWAGVPPKASYTPYEFAERLAAQIPLAARLIVRLADLYVRSLFTRDGLSKEEEREAKSLWPDVRFSFFKHY
ncbi:MAG: transglutaminase domain-containing protein, partial [Chloroflexi bacterium]|nr:transglutaminase domain-containing protein [Chloroflexota bacterium]